jgi:hypothetical protein
MNHKINCNEIYGLYFIDPIYNFNQNIVAISLSTKILNNILNKEINNEERKNYIIKKIKSYSLINYQNKYIFTRNLYMNETKFYKSLYLYNKIIIKNEEKIYEQVLLNILIENFDKNNISNIISNISSKPIIFDKYYEKLILSL